MDHIGECGVWALIDHGRNIVEMVWVQPIERNLWDAFVVKTREAFLRFVFHRGILGQGLPGSMEVIMMSGPCCVKVRPAVG